MGMEHWSAALNFLIGSYFADSITTCIIEHPNFKLNLTSPSIPILNIDPATLADSFARDVYNFSAKEFVELEHDDFVKKLIVAIEHTHCESFVVFQDQIPEFANAFYHASDNSIWRSMRNRFLFAYRQDLVSPDEATRYFEPFLFRDQPNLLVVASADEFSTAFEISSNRFVGMQRGMGWEPLHLINRYDALQGGLLFDRSLHVDKLADLQGREVVVGVFDYKPFMLVNHAKQRLNPIRKSVPIDGTDVRVLLTFCEFRNCSVLADTRSTDWGDVLENRTATGIFELVMKREIDVGIGGLYLWHQAYLFMDISHFLGRSGVTCMVPVAERLISWTLPLRPFHYILWLCVFCSLLLQTCALWLARHFEYFSHDLLHKSKLLHTSCFGIVTALKITVNQSTNYKVNSTSLRMIVLTCYMFDIIMTSAYSGGLSAILTLPTFEEAADSRQRLYAHKLIWAGTTDGWTFAMGEESGDPITKSLIEHYRTYPADVITKYSSTENMAFVVERMKYGQLGNTELIDNAALARLKLMVDDVYFAHYVAYVPRIWPLLATFNSFVLAWHSSGFDKYWEWKIAADYMNANRQNRIVASEHPSKAIGPISWGMNNFMGLIVLWCTGIGLSLLIFLFELLNCTLEMKGSLII